MSIFSARKDGNCYRIIMDNFPYFDYAKEYMRQGSYNVLQARLLGMSYPDYLRLCSGKYGATLRGREGYSYPVFKYEKQVKELCSILNKEWNKLYRALKEERTLEDI